MVHTGQLKALKARVHDLAAVLGLTHQHHWKHTGLGTFTCRCGLALVARPDLAPPPPPEQPGEAPEQG